MKVSYISVELSPIRHLSDALSGLGEAPYIHTIIRGTHKKRITMVHMLHLMGKEKVPIHIQLIKNDESIYEINWTF